MITATRQSAVSIVAMVFSFVAVLVVGQVVFAIEGPKPPVIDLPQPLPKGENHGKENQVGGPLSGRVDLGTVEPDTTFTGSAGSGLDAVVVSAGDGQYLICVTPPPNTAVKGDRWREGHVERLNPQYCREFEPGEDVTVTLVPS